MKMMADLKARKIDAVVAPGAAVLPMAYADASCALQPLVDTLGTSNLGFPFRRGFSEDHPGFIGALNEEILSLSTHQRLQVLPCGACSCNCAMHICTPTCMRHFEPGTHISMHTPDAQPQ